jgi:hypothetical protein
MLFTFNCLGTGSTIENYVKGHVRVFKVENLNDDSLNHSFIEKKGIFFPTSGYFFILGS